jgi:hypothetical protein
MQHPAPNHGDPPRVSAAGFCLPDFSILIRLSMTLIPKYPYFCAKSDFAQIKLNQPILKIAPEEKPPKLTLAVFLLDYLRFICKNPRLIYVT